MGCPSPGIPASGSELISRPPWDCRLAGPVGKAGPDDAADEAAGPGTSWSPRCPWDRCILGMDGGLPHVPTVSTPGLALGASGSSKGDPTRPPSSDGQEEEEEDQQALPPSHALPGAGGRSSAPLAHNSHAADGPCGNRQSSDPYGSFKPPSLPNNPSSGAVLIPSRRQPLGMPGPRLGWINCCAVIFTQQLPALIPLSRPRTSRRATLLLTTHSRPGQLGRKPEDP